jgi:hypothetical protein
MTSVETLLRALGEHRLALVGKLRLLSATESTRTVLRLDSMPACTELFNSVALPQVDRRRTFEESRGEQSSQHGLHRLSSELCGTPPRSTLEYRRHALTFTAILTCSTPLVVEVIVSASTGCPTLESKDFHDISSKALLGVHKSSRGESFAFRVRKSTGGEILPTRLSLLRQTSLLLHPRPLGGHHLNCTLLWPSLLAQH